MAAATVTAAAAAASRNAAAAVVLRAAREAAAHVKPAALGAATSPAAPGEIRGETGTARRGRRGAAAAAVGGVFHHPAIPAAAAIVAAAAASAAAPPPAFSAANRVSLTKASTASPSFSSPSSSTLPSSSAFSVVVVAAAGKPSSLFPLRAKPQEKINFFCTFPQQKHLPFPPHLHCLCCTSCFFSSEAVQRAVRELPWGSRRDLLRERHAPVYVHQISIKTPRREYNVNLFDGIRVRPTVNPFVELNKEKRYVLDNWPSRNWDDWNPYRCYVRGSRKRYNIPEDLFPYKDELGEWHPPRLSARYKADVKKQYLLNGLPWVWEKDFYEGKLHFADRELLGPKRWYRRAFRRERVKEALRKMDDLVLDYRQEVRDKKRYDWFEKVVHDFAGEEVALQFIRKRKEPKF